jgi:CheY-like chemotaxis protein
MRSALAHWRNEKACLQLPRVPVIGLTGDVYARARDACLEAGMDDYLTKPTSKRTSVGYRRVGPETR